MVPFILLDIFSFVHVIYTFISISIFGINSIPVIKFIFFNFQSVFISSLLPRFVKHRMENRLDQIGYAYSIQVRLVQFQTNPA